MKASKEVKCENLLVITEDYEVEECAVSITTLNRIRDRYEEEGFLGLIDKRNGNPDRNKEKVNRVKKF